MDFLLFLLHRPVWRHGRNWAAVAYSLGQHQLQIYLATGGVMHRSANMQVACIL